MKCPNKVYFFFKQKTAYEMRISDWSSDVCSSDLPKEDALVAPPLPAVVQRFVWTIVLRCIPPAQPVAIDEDNPAQHPSIIDTWPAMAPGEIRLKPRHLLVRQPVPVAQIQSPHGA